MSETQVETEVEVVSDDLDTFANDFFGRKSEDEVKPEDTTNSDVEQDADAETEDEAEAQTDETEEAETEEVVEEAAPKKKTVQDRIDEVVRQREEIRRESDRQIAALKAELEAAKTSQQTQVQAPVEAQEPMPDAVDADGNPIYELGEFDPHYIRDLTRFTLEQERSKVQAEALEAQRVAEATQAQQALQSSWNEKVTEAVTAYPDFNEKGRVLLENFSDLPPEYANYIGNVLMSMDKGPDVLYYLSNHPEEAVAIVNSGAQKATLALGRIEARFLQSEQEAPKPKITKAPTPPTVRARGTSGAFISVAPDTDDLDAFANSFFKKKK